MAKQKQKQSQSVIVNVNAFKSRKSKSSRLPSRRKVQQNPNFPIGPRSDPFIPSGYSQPSLSDILNLVQTIKQPISQSIQKEVQTPFVQTPFVQTPFVQPEVKQSPRTISSALSKATSLVTNSNLGFIAQDPSILLDIGRGVFGFGPTAPVAPSQPTLERTRPTENPFSFVDSSPTLSVAPNAKELDQKLRESRLKKVQLIPETQTFVPSENAPLFVNQYASYLPIVDYGLLPETTTLLYQPDADIDEFVDAEDDYSLPNLDDANLANLEGEPLGPLPPQRRVESSGLTQQAEIPSLFVPSYSEDADAPFSPATLERFKQDEEALLEELANPELGELKRNPRFY